MTAWATGFAAGAASAELVAATLLLPVPRGVAAEDQELAARRRIPDPDGARSTQIEQFGQSEAAAVGARGECSDGTDSPPQRGYLPAERHVPQLQFAARLGRIGKQLFEVCDRGNQPSPRYLLY
jgi:hypothetical protein